MNPLTDPETGEILDLWEIGYSYGIDGDTLATSLEDFDIHALTRPMTDSEKCAFERGWAQGNYDKVSRTRHPRTQHPEDFEDLPL